MKNILSLLVATCVVSFSLIGQELKSPFPFSFPDSVVIDTSLIVGAFEKAGDRGRIIAKDGHFQFDDGERFKLVGTTVRLRSCFPDSATAIKMAQRFRALGINHVKFMQFDFPAWDIASILAPGSSSTLGLSESQMQKFDWFTHQLKEHGIYYTFTFHSAWLPRALDGVRQADSVGWGTRIPIFFDKQVQSIHREIMRMLLSHKNMVTGVAYKDDPALFSVVTVEDAAMMAYWLFSKEIVRSTPINATWTVGEQHQALIDSLWTAYLRGKGYTTDVALNAAWTSKASNPANQFMNPGFEDPFDQTSWFLATNESQGAQAIFQFSETEKVSGEFGGRIRIGSPPTTGNSGAIYLRQPLNEVKNKHMYRFSAWMKTTPQQGTRRVQLYLYNATFPFEAYNLNETFEITSEWKKYEFDFVARSSNEASAFIQIRVGLDNGDLFIDDMSFAEVDIPGLRTGESIQQATVQRLPWQDQWISETRARDQGRFYLEQLENMLEAARLYVRDTIGSDVLLCPSFRTYSAGERYAARNYDYFSYNDSRTSTRAFTDEQFGSNIWVFAAANMASKPFVLTDYNVQFPREHQSEIGVVLPAYAALQDWDGVSLGYFSANGLMGNDRSDSNAFWEIYEKPHVLAMFPAMSNAFRNSQISPSPKTMVVSNNLSALDYPQFHASNVYSLSVGADGRMPLIRRIVMDDELRDEESFFPHLEIPSLAGDVDPSALNGENEQIFFNATTSIMRVMSPHYMAVSGRLEGQIIAEPDFIVEQVSEGAHTSLTVSSLTSDPILQSNRNLIVVGARGLNEGAEFNEAGTALRRWGSGPMMIEGRTMRVTLRAPEFDSCHVTPLGADARPMANKRRAIEKSPTGRFSISITTNDDGAPWYLVEFSNVSVSVDEQTPSPTVSVFPNPSTDASFVVRHSGSASTIDVYDVTSTRVASFVATGDRTTIPTMGFAPGTYTVVVDDGLNGITKVVVMK